MQVKLPINPSCHFAIVLAGIILSNLNGLFSGVNSRVNLFAIGLGDVVDFVD